MAEQFLPPQRMMIEGQSLMQGVFAIRTAIDAVKAVVSILPSRRNTNTIPVYRLVPRQQMLLERPAIANELVRMRWPR